MIENISNIHVSAISFRCQYGKMKIFPRDSPSKNPLQVNYIKFRSKKQVKPHLKQSFFRSFSRIIHNESVRKGGAPEKRRAPSAPAPPGRPHANAVKSVPGKRISPIFRRQAKARREWPPMRNRQSGSHCRRGGGSPLHVLRPSDPAVDWARHCRWHCRD